MGLKPSITIKWIQKKDPTCIIFPECTPNVVMAITAIYQSDSHHTTQGGGHSTMSRWNMYMFLLLTHP